MKQFALTRLEIFRAFAFLFLVIAVLTVITYGLRAELLALVVWVGETIRVAPIWGAIVFFLASACSVLFLFLSSVLLVPSAILVWGKWVTFLLLAVGWLTGWIATYAIGRFFRDRTMIEKRLNKQRLNNSFFLSSIPFSLVLIVICSLPAEIVGYALGAVRYPFRSFLLALALVEIPFAFLVVFIGESFIHENIGLLIGLVVLLLGIFVWEVKNARRMKQLS